MSGLSGAAVDRLTLALCAAADRQSGWLVSTGRAAMTLALTSMKRVAADSRRVEVVIPGYTCYSVPAAVARAGLVPRLCDVDPSTLTPDLASLDGIDFGRVLAIASANLYGYPNALAEMEDLSRRNGILMLDDAAQALGARYRDRPAGGFGDVGLFSFDKGKVITTLQGGALVADGGRLTKELNAAVIRLRGASLSGTILPLLKLPIYALLLRPRLYGVIRRLPLGLGLTPYETDYPILRYNRSLAGLAHRQLEHLLDINTPRVRNALRLSEALGSVAGLTMLRVLPGAEAVYTRFPVLADAARRGALIKALEISGIGATASYPRALIDVPQVAARLAGDQRPTPGAREVAKRIVTLPTHGYSPPDLARRVAAVADQALSV